MPDPKGEMTKNEVCLLVHKLKNINVLGNQELAALFNNLQYLSYA